MFFLWLFLHVFVNFRNGICLFCGFFFTFSLISGTGECFELLVWCPGSGHPFFGGFSASERERNQRTMNEKRSYAKANSEDVKRTQRLARTYPQANGGELLDHMESRNLG